MEDVNKNVIENSIKLKFRYFAKFQKQKMKFRSIFENFVYF